MAERGNLSRGWDRTIGLDDRDGPFRYTTFIGNGSPANGAPGPQNTNQWSFIAVAYDGASLQLSLYVDLNAATLEPLTPVTVPTGFGGGFATVAIGGLRPDNANEGWQGFIDNVFIVSGALDAAAMSAMPRWRSVRGGKFPLSLQNRYLTFLPCRHLLN